MFVTKDKTDWRGDRSNTKDSGKGSLSLVCVYVQACDAHLWYCDNLLGDEEKTVKAKTGICYLTQQSQWWNKLFTYCNIVLKSFSQSIAKSLFRVFLHFEVHFIAKQTLHICTFYSTVGSTTLINAPF